MISRRTCEASRIACSGLVFTNGCFFFICRLHFLQDAVSSTQDICAKRLIWNHLNSPSKIVSHKLSANLPELATCLERRGFDAPSSSQYSPEHFQRFSLCGPQSSPRAHRASFWLMTYACSALFCSTHPLHAPVRFRLRKYLDSFLLEVSPFARHGKTSSARA